MLLNNMSKAFNSVIIDARSKSIVTILGKIRICITERLMVNRMVYSNYGNEDILLNIFVNLQTRDCLCIVVTLAG